MQSDEPVGPHALPGRGRAGGTDEVGNEDFTFSVPPTTGQAPATAIVTGEHIARATVNYAPRQRAADAARWLRGQLTIKPTVALAARTFCVSVPLVAEARERLDQRERGKRHANGGGTPNLSDSAIDNIVREVGVERVWAAVERATQPPLPFMTVAE